MYASSNRVFRNARPTESLVFVLGMVGFLLGNFGAGHALCLDPCRKHRPHGGTLECSSVNDPDCSNNCVYCKDDYCNDNTKTYTCPDQEDGEYTDGSLKSIGLYILSSVMTVIIVCCCACSPALWIYCKKRNRAPVMPHGGGYSSAGVDGAVPVMASMPSTAYSTMATTQYVSPSPSPALVTQPDA